ncbi:hypothetical protein D3C75_835130 [compost metagenome]
MFAFHGNAKLKGTERALEGEGLKTIAYHCAAVAEIFSGKIECGFAGSRFSLKHRYGLRLAYTADRRNTGLDDPGLLPCNLLQRIAQNISMIVADICNDRHNRGYNVGYIQPSPKTSLPYDNIGIADFRIIENRQSCSDFEHCRRAQLALCNLFYQRTKLVRKFCEDFLRNIRSIVLKTVREFGNVGRREGSHAITASDQHTGQKSAGRAFAVRTRHMNELELALGLAQLLHQPFNPFQPRADAERNEAVNPIYCFCIRS